MKKKITLTVLALLITGITMIHASGNHVNKVIVANEGYYDYTNSIQVIPVTVGAYDPSTRTYTVFDTILNARFASNVIVDGSSIYVAADSTIIRYDADTYQRLATTNVRGVRKLAVWNNNLLISRGEYLQSFDSYFQVYDKTDLSFLYDLPVASGPRYATEGIIVKGDTAYVAIGNGFDYGNEVGLIGCVNLANQNYLTEINLGAGGTNPEGMFADNDNIYTVNNTNYSTASISNINIPSHISNTVNLATVAGCGASGFAPGLVLFQASYDNQIGRFNTATSNVQDTLKINRNIYGMATDTLNNLIYLGETDYSTYGKIFIYDLTGILVDSFDVSVSPGNIALDIRSTTVGINEPVRAKTLSCYPNPSHDQVLVVVNNDNKAGNTFILSDITGREMNKIHTDLSSFTLNIHTFETGIYILSSLTNPAEKVKIVKQ